MFNHPIHVQQLASDRRLAFETSARNHRLVAGTPRRFRFWNRDVVAGAATGTEPSVPIGSAIPPPGTPEFERWAGHFAQRVAEHGFVGLERHTARVAGVARRHGVAAGCAAIVADRSQPLPARQRALGRVLASLADLSAVGTARSAGTAA